MQMLMLYKCYDNAMITRMKTKFVQKVKIQKDKTGYTKRNVQVNIETYDTVCVRCKGIKDAICLLLHSQ